MCYSICCRSHGQEADQQLSHLQDQFDQLKTQLMVQQPGELLDQHLDKVVRAMPGQRKAETSRELLSPLLRMMQQVEAVCKKMEMLTYKK